MKKKKIGRKVKPSTPMPKIPKKMLCKKKARRKIG